MATDYNRRLISQYPELQAVDTALNAIDPYGDNSMALNNIISDYPLVWDAFFVRAGEGNLDTDNPESIDAMRDQATACAETILAWTAR